MRINIYKRATNSTNYKLVLIDTINVKKQYIEAPYFCEREIIGGNRCAKILNTIYPHYKAQQELVVIENAETGYRWLQNINRNGTILL